MSEVFTSKREARKALNCARARHDPEYRRAMQEKLKLSQQRGTVDLTGHRLRMYVPAERP